MAMTPLPDEVRSNPTCSFLVVLLLAGCTGEPASPSGPSAGRHGGAGMSGAAGSMEPAPSGAESPAIQGSAGQATAAGTSSAQPPVETKPPAAGSAGSAAAPPQAGMDAMDRVGPNGRPSGVSECYSAMSTAHPATARHWQAFGRAGHAERGAMIQELEAAAAEHPGEQQFAMLLALANVWRAAEPSDAFDLLAALGSAQTAERELERAYALCPTDHRIPAWLGPVKVRLGRILGDPALVAEGIAVLDKGIEHYPAFVVFAKLLVYAPLPAHDPEFPKALEAVPEVFMACAPRPPGEVPDPACINQPFAPHSLEGTQLYIGDLYAKARKRELALAAYEAARTSAGWATWPYQDVIEVRVRELDVRIAAAATPEEGDDLEAVWDSDISCSACHRE